MQTVERSVETLGEPLRKTNRYLVAALAILVLAVVGFGAWMLIDEYTGVDREIELLVQDWYEAWDAGDGEAVLAMMSPTARHYDRVQTRGLGGESLVEFVEGLEIYSFTAVGEPLISEITSAQFAVAQKGIISDDHGLSVFRIRIVNDEMKIYMHRWVD